MLHKAAKKTLYLSFGENCLTDDILKRFEIKSYSTPFSSARSNIEYILFHEKNKYRDFLNPDYLDYQDCYGKRVVRLTIGKEIINKYETAHMKGFEFTHHDVINNPTHREAFERRYKRLLSFDGECLTIFYHHRCCDRTDWNILLSHLNELRLMYLKRGVKKVNIVVFTQSIVNNENSRKVDHFYLKHIHIYVFRTLHVWAGNDQDIFWARIDDDLIGVMIRDARQGFLGKYTLKMMLQGLQYTISPQNIHTLLNIPKKD